MKKGILLIALLASFVFAACGDKKTNPLWGMWVLQDEAPVKTEIMFNDDNTGFVFIADDVRFETTWSQDSLLNVTYVEMYSGKQGKETKRSYRLTLDGDKMRMEDTTTGAVLDYTRYEE